MNYLWIIGHFIGFSNSCEWAVFVEVGWQVNTKMTVQPAEHEAGDGKQEGRDKAQCLSLRTNHCAFSSSLKISRIAVSMLHFGKFTICSSSFKKMFWSRVWREVLGWIWDVLRDNFIWLSLRLMEDLLTAPNIQEAELGLDAWPPDTVARVSGLRKASGTSTMIWICTQFQQWKQWGQEPEASRADGRDRRDLPVCLLFYRRDIEVQMEKVTHWRSGLLS